MAGRSRSTFITLKSKGQKTEDDEDEFHFTKKRAKREMVIYIICKLE